MCASSCCCRVVTVGVGESLKESDLLTRQTTRATLCEFEVKTSKMTVFEQKKISIEGRLIEQLEAYFPMNFKSDLIIPLLKMGLALDGVEL